jgi:hypothetical protein
MRQHRVARRRQIPTDIKRCTCVANKCIIVGSLLSAGHRRDFERDLNL